MKDKFNCINCKYSERICIDGRFGWYCTLFIVSLNRYRLYTLKDPKNTKCEFYENEEVVREVNKNEN